ncbi:MAG: GXWXG domain-containing protein [Flavobacteriales bacterium]
MASERIEIITGHPTEGLLEPSCWYGKLFIDNRKCASAFNEYHKQKRTVCN